MATKSGFSKVWQGFVDHKWSKKRFGTSFALVSLQTHYQELRARAVVPQSFQATSPLGGKGVLGQSRRWSNEVLPGTRCIAGRALKGVLILSTFVLEMSTTKGLADLLFGRTRGCPCAALRPRRSVFLHTGNRREVDASVGAVQRELGNLSKVELIRRKSVGSQVF